MGQTWVYWGEMNFPIAAGDAIYSGFSGPDLMGIQAQYILLTAISNHGDPNCAGFTEIKFNLVPGDSIYIPANNCLAEIILPNTPILSGTYQAAESINATGTLNNDSEVHLKAGNAVELGAFFEVTNGSVLDVAIEACGNN